MTLCMHFWHYLNLLTDGQILQNYHGSWTNFKRKDIDLPFDNYQKALRVSVKLKNNTILQ